MDSNSKIIMKTTAKVRFNNRIFEPHFANIDSFEKLKNLSHEDFLLPDKQLIPSGVGCLKSKENDQKEKEEDISQMVLKGNQKFRAIIQKRINLSNFLGDTKMTNLKEKTTEQTFEKIVDVKHNQDEINSIIDMYNASTFKMLILADFSKKMSKEIVYKINDQLKFKNGRTITFENLMKRTLDSKTVLCIVTDTKFLRDHWTSLKSINCKIKNIFLHEEEVI